MSPADYTTQQHIGLSRTCMVLFVSPWVFLLRGRYVCACMFVRVREGGDGLLPRRHFARQKDLCIYSKWLFFHGMAVKCAGSTLIFQDDARGDCKEVQPTPSDAKKGIPGRQYDDCTITQPSPTDRLG